MAATDGSFDSADEDITSATGQIDTTGWTSGTHLVYVRSQDALGNWGPMVSSTFVIDRVGPTTSALTLTPNPSNGSVGVVLSGTASDAATGNQNVTAAEYFLGAPGASGSGSAMSLNKLAPTVSLSATIAAPGSSAVVSVHAQDAAGNWGPYTTIALTVDPDGPATSSISANPPANNGSYGQSSTLPSVRITATISDAASGGSRVAAGEGFIDGGVIVDGSGFPFLPVDGVFDSSTEVVAADIPLSTINLLTSGNHVIRVHGKDAVGNWGTPVSLTYLIDRTAPTFSSISLSPSPTYGATTVTLTVNGASDPAVSGLFSGVAGGEYWIGTTVPAAGSGTRFSGLTASIPVGSLATGSYTIGARVRDAAGNWSTVTHTATLVVVPNAIFSNGFESGGRPWGWSSASTNSTTRMNVTSTTPMVGTRMLQAQGNNTNYVQYNFGTAAQPATSTYDARFYFNPNNNASTGQDILAAATSNTFGTQLFHVRYRRNGAQPQVQIQVGNTANATWTNINNNVANVIEVTWQAGGSLQLTVNGTLAQTLTAGSGSVGAVRLGSVTNGGSSTLEFFDAFASKRLLTPLYGP
jgi:hypothetical protein